MQKKILINLLIVLLCCTALTTVALFAIQTAMAHNTADKTSSSRLKDLTERITQNELQIEELTAALKEDYISRARALSMTIELDPDIIKDRDKLNEVTAALNVDEVHIIDENGILQWGTEPKYYGMNFASTEQTSPFLAILDDPATEIAQDLMPNGFEGLMRQYAGVSLRNRKGVAQVGMVPERLEKALENNQLCNVLTGISVGSTGYIFAVSKDTNSIHSHRNKQLMGTPLSEPLYKKGFMTVDGQRVRYSTQAIDDNILAVAVIPTTELYAQRIFYTGIFLIFMIVLFSSLWAIMSLYIKRNIVDGILDTVSTLEKISAGNLDVTASARSSIEFDKLSDGINIMLKNIRTGKLYEKHARRFDAVISSADAGIIVKDKDGIIQEWNVGAENILGYKREEILGKTTRHYAPEEAHAGIDVLQGFLEKGKHIAHVEVIRKHKDGHLIYCSASYTPIFDDNNVFNGSVAIFHDMSEKKQIERQLMDTVLAAQEASRMKSAFIANMSHEIRTPMNGIIGFAELAIDDVNVPEKTKDYMSKIKLGAEGLLEIINNILDISKIEAGKMDLEKTPFSLHEIFKYCESIISLKASEKGVAVYFHTEPLITKKLLGDPTKLRQILLNLLSNSVKFTDKGIIELTANVSEITETDVTVHFEIKDSGIGMSDEQIQKIFEPFTQADNSTTRKFGGTGLGLAITGSMVELMGGKLTVESTLGLGSKFSFTLPFEIVEMSDDAYDNAETGVGEIKKPIFNGEVLVCEDNIINQQVISEHLSRTGLKVTVAKNGMEGVEAVNARSASKNPFDLIFMDIHMPLMDGLEASRMLIKAGNRTPIIALTANAMSEEKEMYLDAGMLDYLSKPFTQQTLWTCLLRHLSPVELTCVQDAQVTSGYEETNLINRRLGIELAADDEELYDRLLKDFAKDNETTIEKLNAALDEGDIKLAHHIAHTLKGASATIGAVSLSGSAAIVENALSRKYSNFSATQVNELKEKLDRVLAELTPITIETNDENIQTAVLDKERAIELLERLVPLLESGSSGSLSLLPEIKEVILPFGDICNTLVTQMENYDFELASDTANDIKRLIGGYINGHGSKI